MRIVVMSDSHGDSRAVEEVMARERRAAGFIHLGDGARDWMHTIPGAGQFLIGVRGNGDFNTDLPLTLIDEWCGKKIFCSHGHIYRVKMGLTELRLAAAAVKADITLYGHTHIPDIDRQGECWFICPGSINSNSGKASYAVLEITESKVNASIYRL